MSALSLSGPSMVITLSTMVIWKMTGLREGVLAWSLGLETGRGES